MSAAGFSPPERRRAGRPPPAPEAWVTPASNAAGNRIFADALLAGLVKLPDECWRKWSSFNAALPDAAPGLPVARRLDRLVHGGLQPAMAVRSTARSVSAR